MAASEYWNCFVRVAFRFTRQAFQLRFYYVTTPDGFLKWFLKLFLDWLSTEFVNYFLQINTNKSVTNHLQAANGQLNRPMAEQAQNYPELMARVK